MATFNATVGNDLFLGTFGDDVVLNAGVGLDIINTGVGNDTVTLVPDSGGLLDILPDIITMGTGEDHLIIDYRNVSSAVTMAPPLLGIDGLSGGLDLLGLEALTFAGVDRFTVRSGSGADILYGASLSDALYGGAGADTLHGLAGNDTLDGGKGVDTMFGGLGDDIYFVDSAADVVTEMTGEGYDIIYSAVSHSVEGTAVESLRLTGNKNGDATGNELDNYLVGSNGNNVLNGGDGADIMAGRHGDDTYYVDDASDTVVENATEGLDSVISNISYTLADNVENMTLSGFDNNDGVGNGLDNVMFGNDQDNALSGLLGDDIINGAGGADVLTGGAGADAFLFRSVSDSAVGLSDRITDLTNDDVINLLKIDANTNKAGNQDFRIVDELNGGAGQLALHYDAGTNLTTVLGDVNGDGVADFRLLINGDHHDFTNFVL